MSRGNSAFGVHAHTDGAGGTRDAKDAPNMIAAGFVDMAEGEQERGGVVAVVVRSEGEAAADGGGQITDCSAEANAEC